MKDACKTVVGNPAGYKCEDLGPDDSKILKWIFENGV
jgi:hypothetical protein